MNIIKLYKMIYKTGGMKSIVFTILQSVRVSIFWTKDMKRKNPNRVSRFIGRQIFVIQNSKVFEPKENKYDKI